MRLDRKRKCQPGPAGPCLLFQRQGFVLRFHFSHKAAMLNRLRRKEGGKEGRSKEGWGELTGMIPTV